MVFVRIEIPNNFIYISGENVIVDKDLSVK